MIDQVIALIDNALVTLQSGGNPADVIGMLTQARGIAEQIERQGPPAPAAAQVQPNQRGARTPPQAALQQAFGNRVAPTVHDIAREIFVSISGRPQGGTVDEAYEHAEKFLAGPSQQFQMQRQAQTTPLPSTTFRR